MWKPKLCTGFELGLPWPFPTIINITPWALHTHTHTHIYIYIYTSCNYIFLLWIFKITTNNIHKTTIINFWTISVLIPLQMAQISKNLLMKMIQHFILTTSLSFSSSSSDMISSSSSSGSGSAFWAATDDASAWERISSPW